MPGHSSNYTQYDGRFRKSRHLQISPDQISIERDVEVCSRAGPWSMVPKPYTYRVAGQNGAGGNEKSGKQTGRANTVTEEKLFSTVQRAHDARNTRSSKGDNRRGATRSRSAHSCVWHRDPHKVYGSQGIHPEHLSDVVQRLTTPTIASRGGVDLADKKFIYIPPPKCKTFIIIPELETRFLGRKVNREQLSAIVERLSRRTQATNARFAMDPHSWYDDSPWAERHRAQTAMGLRR